MKARIAFEDKIRIVRDYLSGKTGYSDSVKAANNSESTFRGWVAQYTAGGATALLPSERNNRYPAELKESAVKEYLSGTGSLEGICLKYKIRSDRQLRQWIKVYNAHGDLNFVKHSGGGSYMRKARRTTQGERIQIVNECIASGKNYGEMALKYSVSYQ